MLVRATRLGYYGIKRRRPGAVFKIKNEKEFSEVWMEKIDKMPVKVIPEPEVEPEIEEEVIEEHLLDDDDVI